MVKATLLEDQSQGVNSSTRRQSVLTTAVACVFPLTRREYNLRKPHGEQ
jgi:hypothetical protein